MFYSICYIIVAAIYAINIKHYFFVFRFAATPSDAGDYICEATNKLDTAKITVSIDVLGK